MDTIIFKMDSNGSNSGFYQQGNTLNENKIPFSLDKLESFIERMKSKIESIRKAFEMATSEIYLGIQLLSNKECNTRKLARITALATTRTTQ